MTWEEVEKKYGKRLANKMKKSPYMSNITVSLLSSGETDFPERDIWLAYKDVCKLPIHSLEWD
jgi:hypothetical protein